MLVAKNTEYLNSIIFIYAVHSVNCKFPNQTFFQLTPDAFTEKNKFGSS